MDFAIALQTPKGNPTQGEGRGSAELQRSKPRHTCARSGGVSRRLDRAVRASRRIGGRGRATCPCSTPWLPGSRARTGSRWRLIAIFSLLPRRRQSLSDPLRQCRLIKCLDYRPAVVIRHSPSSHDRGHAVHNVGGRGTIGRPAATC